MMRAKLLATGVILLIAIAALMLIVSVVLPSFLDPRNFAAWRERRAARVPLPFYAKVVDERGEPVEGATITLQVNLHNSAELVGKGFVDEREVVLTTDPNGLAQLRGYKGFSIYVLDVEKDGYNWFYDADLGRRNGALFTDMTGFEYAESVARYVADPDNPAVFPLYREGITKPLPEAGSAALPSRGGFTDGVKGEPFVPRASSLEDNWHARWHADIRRSRREGKNLPPP